MLSDFPPTRAHRHAREVPSHEHEPARRTAAMTLSRNEFGRTPDGDPVDRYTLANASGATVDILTLGASIASIRVPDREGRLGEVVLGFDDLAHYLAPRTYFGALVGRYANRIAGARFELDGRAYRLEPNDGPHHLHGGTDGMHKRIWRASQTGAPAGAALRLDSSSEDGHAGYPGRLETTVEYRWSDACELEISLEARTDRPTVVNLTSHPYFNLAGSGDVLGHRLTIAAQSYLPVDAGLIPTGELRAVAETAFDFRVPRAMGARIGDADDQLARGDGYDHCYALDPRDGAAAVAARVDDPASGRRLEVRTTQPGLQFYSGNHLKPATGRGGAFFGRRSAFCLETQHFPDSPHHPHFPTTVLRPGHTYRHVTVYAFGVA
jgi:aldose 1-epimerase